MSPNYDQLVDPTFADSPYAANLNLREERNIKYASSRKNILFYFAAAQIILAFLLLVLGSVSIGLDYEGDFYQYNHFNALVASIWTSLISMVAGVLGLVVSKRRKSRCLTVAYLVLCIFATAAVVLLIIETSVDIGAAAKPARKQVLLPENQTQSAPSHYYSRYETVYEYTWYGKAQMALKIVMAVLAIVQFVCCNISSGLICAIWSKTGCCGGQTPSVVYVQNPQIPVAAETDQYNQVFVPLQQK